MAKRGRPKASEEPARREAVIQAALAELTDKGYDKITMLGIAKRAGASKETLYTWFGSKEGLFAVLIQHQAEATVARLNTAFDGRQDVQETLTAFTLGFLKLLLGEPSVSLNRAAMAAPELASVLLQHGRHTAGPIVERYLKNCAEDGKLTITDPARAFQLLYGLIVQDWQIRVLLGENPPTEEDLTSHAERAVCAFVKLCEDGLC